jgi:hypothetical protein
VNVAILDNDVADVYADPERDPLFLWVPALWSTNARCTASAQKTASTTLGNSIIRPSPVVLTVRPWCSSI